MKKSLLFFAAAVLMLSACKKGLQKTESGIEYRIIEEGDGAREITSKETLVINLRMATEGNDSVILETFSTNTPRYIPANEPTLGEVFAKLAKGDSVDVFVSADSFFQKTYQRPKPEWIASEGRIHFTMKIVDVLDQAAIEKKMMEQEAQMKAQAEQMKGQVEEYKKADSVALKAYVKNLKNVKKTASGLMYIVEKEGTGTKVKNGDEISMRYKGYLMSGEVFDENMSRPEPLKFQVGTRSVIPGWDEAALLMKEGAKMKLIVPWHLAYGEQSPGEPIMPCTSLIFDVELVKVN